MSNLPGLAFQSGWAITHCQPLSPLISLGWIHTAKRSRNKVCQALGWKKSFVAQKTWKTNPKQPPEPREHKKTLLEISSDPLTTSWAPGGIRDNRTGRDRDPSLLPPEELHISLPSDRLSSLIPHPVKLKKKKVFRTKEHQEKSQLYFSKDLLPVGTSRAGSCSYRTSLTMDSGSFLCSTASTMGLGTHRTFHFLPFIWKGLSFKDPAI